MFGELHLAAGNPIGALPYAHSALLHARLLHFDLLAAESAVLLSKLWCQPLVGPVATGSVAAGSVATGSVAAGCSRGDCRDAGEDGTSWGKKHSPAGCSSQGGQDRNMSGHATRSVREAGLASRGGGPRLALHMLQEWMPLVLAHGRLQLQGRLGMAAADSLLTLAGSSAGLLAAGPGEVLQLLQSAAAAFERCNDWGRAAEAAGVAAHVYEACGHEKARNAAAAAALAYEQQALAFC
jgi:hypothetical protein